jgi:hypothetical protein
MTDSDEFLSELRNRDDVIDVPTAMKFLSRDEIRWRVESGRWQRTARGILVTHSGPITAGQAYRIAQMWAGPGAVIGGFTAARLDGLTWFAGNRGETGERIDLLLPPGRRIRAVPDPLDIAVHYSRSLGPEDVHPLHEPKRTRIERSLVDAASWAPNDRLAMAVLAAGVQQGLTVTGKLRVVVDRNERRYRHRLIRETLADIEGGAQALSELDFTRKVVRAFGLPDPERQSARRDDRGRRRYLDVVWERWKVIVEIDGAQHIEDPMQRWDDMERDIDLQIDGYRVLRVPAWLVRMRPDIVARKIRKAFRAAEESCLRESLDFSLS